MYSPRSPPLSQVLVSLRAEHTQPGGEGDRARGQAKDGSGPDSPTSPLGAPASLQASWGPSAPLWKSHTPLSSWEFPMGQGMPVAQPGAGTEQLWGGWKLLSMQIPTPTPPASGSVQPYPASHVDGTSEESSVEGFCTQRCKPAGDTEAPALRGTRPLPGMPHRGRHTPNSPSPSTPSLRSGDPSWKPEGGKPVEVSFPGHTAGPGKLGTDTW